jgi:signal transduction histidine kinase
MKKSQKHISIFIYVLMGYTILQFFWWTYLIFELNLEIIELKKVLYDFSATSEAIHGAMSPAELDAIFEKKKLMILGEGGIFLLILLTGFYLIKRSHDRELYLAKQERNFMLAITHELNSPLASIKLNIETLLRRSLSEDKVRMVLNRTAQETERLHHLVNNVLATSRMEQTGFELFPEEINLVEHVRGLVKKYNTSFPQKIQLDFEEEFVAQVDALGFELILQNLLENASKYSSEDSEINIELRENQKMIELRVVDSGIGISDEEKPKVLAKFYRVGDESTRKSKGTGLGLYLVSSLVDEMKGRLTIEDNPSGGTIFTVFIPSGN